MKKSKQKNNLIKTNERKINYKVIIYSLIAIICLVLTYIVDWMFIIPVLFLIWLNQRELFLKKK